MSHDKLEKQENIQLLTILYLMKLINQLNELKDDIILGIDANEAFTSNSGDITKLYKQCKFINPISTKHDTIGEPNTYERGYQRIDYIFYSSHIYIFITKYGFLPFCSIVTYEHRDTFIDVDIP